MPAWSDYQEEVADFFRSLGLSADTEVCVDGARTRHDVDVVVRSRHAGLDVVWLVECKAWRTAIPKEKVLALRTIVDDTGADRGFIMAEKGYQSGALEAALHANVMLTSLADLKEVLAFELGVAKLRSVLDRAEDCRERYWALSKSDRIEFDLRPEPGGLGFMGDAVAASIESTVRLALRHGFPVIYDRTMNALLAYGGRRPPPVQDDQEGAIPGPSELYDVLHTELIELERRLEAAEASVMTDRGELRSAINRARRGHD